MNYSDFDNSTDYIIQCIHQKIPVSFLKFGDGEYLCAILEPGGNVDGDLYTLKLSNALIHSFIYMSTIAINSYFALWHGAIHQKEWESLIEYRPVKWVKYHTLIFDKKDDDKKIELFKLIKNTNDYQKLVICNNKMSPMINKLLNTDNICVIPENNWFDEQFETVLQLIKNFILHPENQLRNKPFIILTMCGMSAKVLICELYKIFPAYIYLDVGSTFDVICTNTYTRIPPSYTIDEIQILCQDLLK